MVKNSTKILSLVFAAALALVLFVGASPSTSDGATDYVIEAPADWAVPTTLQDGDTLFIKASAGNPVGPYGISIAADANVAITGEGNLLTGVYIRESHLDTTEHSVAIKDLNLDASGTEAYTNYKGVISVFGANYLKGGSANGILSNGELTLKGDGALAAYSTGREGIKATGLTLKETVGLNVSGAATTLACDLGGGMITMDAGTTFVMTNIAATAESHQFAMSADGSKWLISGGASFVASMPASNPATISVAAGGTGSVILASPPGIFGPTAETKNVGYAAFSTDAFTVTGSPTPTVTMTPGDPKITWNSGTMKLSIAAGLPAGEYTVTLKAENGFVPAATTSFLLTVVPPSTVTSVTVDPSTVDVKKGTMQTFTATVEGTGSPPTTVTWSVTGQEDTNTNINPTTGVLTVAAGETASALTVTATSTFDTTKSGTATVTVKAEDPGGGSNTILWVAIAAVIVIAVLGLLFFLFKKP